MTDPVYFSVTRPSEVVVRQGRGAHKTCQRGPNAAGRDRTDSSILAESPTPRTPRRKHEQTLPGASRVTQNVTRAADIPGMVITDLDAWFDGEGVEP